MEHGAAQYSESGADATFVDAVQLDAQQMACALIEQHPPPVPKEHAVDAQLCHEWRTRFGQQGSALPLSACGEAPGFKWFKVDPWRTAGARPAIELAIPHQRERVCGGPAKEQVGCAATRR